MDKVQDVVRVGSKVISREKIDRVITDILNLRGKGLSQQEVARRLDLERTFISRLETVGEIRKGQRIALVGFPIANKEELLQTTRELGVDYVWLMNNEERWELIREKKVMDFFGIVVQIIAELKKYDLLVMLVSEKWYRIALAFLDIQVILLDLGQSPIEKDCLVDPQRIINVINKFSDKEQEKIN